MKNAVKHIVLAAATAISLAASVGSAFAAPQDSGTAATGGLTRAQVHAEVLRARAAGELDFNETNYPAPLVSAPSHLTRAEVHDQAVAARKAGELDFNDTNYPPEVKQVSMTSRMAVHDEAVRARADGELNWTDVTYPDAAEHASR